MPDRIVEVEWEDSGATHGWASDEEIATVKPSLILTVGFIHEDSGAMIRLLSDIPAGGDDGDAKGRVIAIPRSAIRKVTELKRGSRRR